MMKLKQIWVVFLIYIVIFSITVPAFAYESSGYSGYLTPGSSGSSPYSGSAGGSGSGSGGNAFGSGIGTGGMPGSGTGGYGGGSSGSEMSGSGAAGGGSSDAGGPSTGSFSGGSFGSAGNDYLEASVGLDGSLVLSVPTAAGVGSGTLSDSASYLIQKYKTIGTAVFGVCAITAILCMLWQITKLGAAGDNQRSRSMAIKGILISGATIAIFGSITLVAGFFWGAFL